MQILLTEEQYEKLLSFNYIDPKIVLLFKYLNKNRHKYPTHNSLLHYIKKILKYFGLDEEEAGFWYYQYVINYRKDGKYEETRMNARSDKKVQYSSHVKAKEFVDAKVPFKSHNSIQTNKISLNAVWEIDEFNVPQYVVISYGWYPIYIWKQGSWFEVDNRYSSSTLKQMYKLKMYRKRTILLSSDEMKLLRGGMTYEKILDERMNFLIKDTGEQLIKAGERVKRFREGTVTYKFESFVRNGDELQVRVNVTNVKPDKDIFIGELEQKIKTEAKIVISTRANLYNASYIHIIVNQNSTEETSPL